MDRAPDSAGGFRRSGGVAVGSALALLVVGLSFFWQFLRDANLMALFVPCNLLGAAISPRGWTLAFYGASIAMACVVAFAPRARWVVARPAVLPGCAAAVTVLGLCAHAAPSAGPGMQGVLPAVQLAEVCLLAVLFATLAAFWARACSWMMACEDRRATWGILGSALASLVFSFVGFTLVPFKALLPLATPLAASLLAVAYGRCGPGPGPDEGEGRPEGRMARPSSARALFGVLVGVLVVSTCAKGMYDVLVAGSIETSMQLKHFITIAELAAIMLVCLCATGVERLAFLGWAVLTGGLVTGLALMAVTGSAVLMQVGLGTIAAARTCCEAFAFALVCSRERGDGAARTVLATLAVPELAACLAGYGALPALLTSTGAEVRTLVGLVSIGLVVAVVVGAFALTGSFALRGLGKADGEAGGRASDGGAASPVGAPRTVKGAHAAGGERHAAEVAQNLADAVAPQAVGRIGELGDRYGLTPREREVAAYVFRGYSAKRIAEIDCVSLNTVQSHTRNVYRKLGVHSRQELIDLVEGADDEA